MKKLTLTLAAASLILFACNSEKKPDDKTAGDSITVKDKTIEDPCAGYVKDTSMKMPMDSNMMNQWMAFATPGEMHKMLAKDDGVWEGEVIQWMDPAAPPTTSKSKATNKMIMGGRYQMSEHSGCFGGMPFEGLSLVGYDNNRKVFMSTWIHNMGSSFMNMEGTYDSASKTIRLMGECTNPMGGGKQKVREDFVYVDDNTQKMIMYGPDMKGKEYKMMEITFKRKP